ncbi:hypothetical protein FSP39_019627 [Pinctada imbricata]|uniref:VWA7 N-terminal domain-containing protein n=1 Tax=Pinctada imbricata TaxID=66713 RepID=A0AA89C8B4_PINIB|nr:hypothetical protein FSP39_019627 [Pinctada imbricata]
MQSLRSQIIQELLLAEPDYVVVRERIGQYLHLLQMFYSNTNWIEVRGQEICRSLGSLSNYTTGKCSHGGPQDSTSSTSAALGGINKDTGNPLYSPHFYLHTSAALTAIEHTRRFFSDKG